MHWEQIKQYAPVVLMLAMAAVVGWRGGIVGWLWVVVLVFMSLVVLSRIKDERDEQAEDEEEVQG